MTARLTPEALADLRSARSWYADRGPGLDEEFLASFESVLDRLSEHPEAYPLVHRNIRRALLGRFPYCVFYLVEQEGPVVLAHFHARRNPAAWRRRAGA